MDRRRATLRETDALYIISVAARLVNMHPNTLRKYEREGFLEPSRLGGKLRLYSSEDIARLQQIRYLVEERGLNLAGIDLALEITDTLQRLFALMGAESAGAESQGPERNGPTADDRALRQVVCAVLVEVLDRLGARICGRPA